jgi:kynureninase
MTHHTLASLTSTPNSLARFYSAFRVSERLLFTGHSHQAWPDCARDGLVACFDDAAKNVDEKWALAMQRMERVRQGYRRWLGDSSGHVAIGASTHDLIVKWLSALPLRKKPRLVTTDGEFHSLRRQLDRLAEEGLEIVRVPASPVATLAGRLHEAARQDASRTAAVFVSSVLFSTGEIVPSLGEIGPKLAHLGVEFLIDAYHHFGIVPFSMQGLEQATIAGGGYKYLQYGEGNCCLRFPEQAVLRPVVTGWFAEFPWLNARERPELIPYDQGPSVLSGATYDPASNYRAASVVEFFEQQGLTIDLLRAISQHHTGRIREAISAFDVPPATLTFASAGSREAFGGFVAVRAKRAEALAEALAKRGVHIDRRGDIIRFGPAPYLCDRQIDDAMSALREALATV